jgi:folate-dependent phosphoribosylglycinamide formyltransferase PurN
MTRSDAGSGGDGWTDPVDGGRPTRDRPLSADGGSDARTVVLLMPADAVKSTVALQNLLSSASFRARYDPRVVVDGASGRLVDALRRRGVRYAVASDPGSPAAAIERVTEDDPSFAYLVSCGWTKLIPAEAIETPEEAALNCHGSYLPDYRGPAMHRVQWANGRRWGGASVHFLTEEFDDGRILCRDRFKIRLTETPKDVLWRSAEATATLLREALLLVENGYEGIENASGSYYSLTGWPTVLAHGAVNRALWAFGSDVRWEVDEG